MSWLIRNRDAIFLAIMVIAFLAMSHSAYLDELSAEEWYIRDVCSGIHPDYLGLEVQCER